MKNLLIVLFLFLSTISTAFAADLSNLAQCAPYDFTVPGDCNWGVGDGSFSREWLDKNYHYRIRQNGTIKGIRAYFGDLKGVTEFYVKIWRYNDTTAKYDLIGVSENLIDKISSNQINDVILDSPIAEVQEGDYYGGRIVGDNGVQLVAKPLPVDPAWGLYYETDSPSIVSGYNWEASPSRSRLGLSDRVFHGPSLIGLYWGFLDL